MKPSVELVLLEILEMWSPPFQYLTDADSKISLTRGLFTRRTEYLAGLNFILQMSAQRSNFVRSSCSFFIVLRFYGPIKEAVVSKEANIRWDRGWEVINVAQR